MKCSEGIVEIGRMNALSAFHFTVADLVVFRCCSAMENLKLLSFTPDEKCKNLIVEDQCYPTECYKLLNGFRKSKRFTDVVLKVAGGEFDAHRAVLSAASPFFSAMFNDDLMESQLKTVDLMPESNTEILSAVLDYMYSGKLTIPPRSARLLVQNLDYFQLEGAKRKLETVLMDNITIQNCIEFFTIADETMLSGLRKTAADFLSKNFATIYSNEEVRNLNLNQMENVLTIVSPSCPDAACKAIFSWIKHDNTNRDLYLSDLLSKYVKINSLSEDLVTKKVPKYFLNENLLMDKEEGRKWMIESLFGLKSPHLYLFSMEANNPFYAFNIAGNSLRQLGNRTGLSYFSVAKYKDAIYAVGGLTKNGLSDQSFKYDVMNNMWTNIGFSVKKHECGVCITDDKIYAAGGSTFGKGSNDFLLYDLKSGKQSRLPSMQFNRYSPALVSHNSSLYAFGGDCDNPRYEVERYDPRERKWSIAGKLSIADAGFTAAATTAGIYCKGWNTDLQLYRPGYPTQSTYTNSDRNWYYEDSHDEEIARNALAFGTIAYCDENLYLAQEEGISKYNQNGGVWSRLFTCSWKSPFIVA